MAKKKKSLIPKQFTTGRIVLLVFLAFIQISWFTALLTALSEHATWVNLALRFLSFMIIVYLVRKDENPAYRNSWLILILIMPVFGGLFYFLFGNKRPAQKMAQKLKNQIEAHRFELMDEPSAYQDLLMMAPRQAALANYINEVATMPVYTDTDVVYYPNGESAFEDILKALKAAEHHIFLEFFIIKLGDMTEAIFEILKEKASQGIDVRLIYDDFGCLTTLPPNFVQEMAHIGVKCHCFNPFTPIFSLAVNTRDHRKIIVIDGKIGFTGGVNLADEYINRQERFGYWKDNMVKLEGPAVWNLSTMFLDMWNAFVPTDDNYDAFKADQVMTCSASGPEAKGFVQVFGDTPLDGEPLGENVYREIINMAVDYVYIYTPYLVISHELQTSLTLAAKRGVDVRLMTPGIPDKKLVFRMTRSYYRPLLEAGVKVFEYTPGFLHAKTFISDGKIATVGSINLDYRSLYLHFELNTVMYHHPVIAEIYADFVRTQSIAKEINLTDLKGTLVSEIFDSLLRLLAPFV